MEPDELEKRLYQLTERVEENEQKSSEKFDKLIEAQRINTDAIGEIANSVMALVGDTSAIIKLHRDFQGATRVGQGMQGFMMWCLRWGVIGTGVVVIINWLIEKFHNAS